MKSKEILKNFGDQIDIAQKELKKNNINIDLNDIIKNSNSGQVNSTVSSTVSVNGKKQDLSPKELSSFDDFDKFFEKVEKQVESSGSSTKRKKSSSRKINIKRSFIWGRVLLVTGTLLLLGFVLTAISDSVNLDSNPVTIENFMLATICIVLITFGLKSLRKARKATRLMGDINHFANIFNNMSTLEKEPQNNVPMATESSRTKETINVECNGCAAVFELPKGSTTKCEYCGLDLET